MAEPTIHRCIASFAYPSDNGGTAVIGQGAIVSSDSPAYRGHESSFEPVQVTADRQAGKSVEQATAAPGEKRSTRRGKSVEQADNNPDEPEA